MFDPSQREWRFYIADMIGFAEKIVAYNDGMDQEQFVASGLNYDATVRYLIMVVEAATHAPDHVRTFANAIVWRQVISTRNRLNSRLSGHQRRCALGHHPERNPRVNRTTPCTEKGD